MTTDVVTDTSCLESLDFTIEQPCEHPQHYDPDDWHETSEGAALYVRRLQCPNCGNAPSPQIIALCQSAYDRAGQWEMCMQCSVCGQPANRDDLWRYLGPVNP